jgi:mannose-1-phosphate guanylyltransferase/mannose-6-phosphate isomerase
MEAVIILAGGSGTRLWPASTKEKPKQFLTLGLEKSFLQMSVERGLAVNPDAEVVVVTHRDYVEGTADQLAAYAARGSRITILPEPTGRNTAPAIAFAGLYLEGRLPETARALILSADHLIRPLDRFVTDAKKAAELGGRGFIAVFGIPPTEPNTGYGYIEAGAAEGPGFQVAAFKEKPDAAAAAAYVEAGRYYWNSGMFLFSLKTLKEEFAAHAPEIAAPFDRLGRSLFAGAAGSAALSRRIGGIAVWGEGKEIEELFGKLPSISVDYAVLEKSGKVAMVRADFEWNDVGSWDEVARLLPGEYPELFSEDAEGCAVYSDIPVALCGVRDLVVVVRNGRALVLKKGSSQHVRGAAEALEKPDTP